MNDTPENLSAPKAEKPNRAQVLESLKTIQDFATHIKGQPLKPEQSFQLRVFEQTVNNTPLQNGISQTENSFVSTETGQKFSQQEGIPLNELIQITTERLGTEGLSLEEQKKLMQHIDILRASSKSFMSFPERIDPDQYKARIEQEAAMMSKVPGETRSHQELLAEADRILKDRIELVLPDDEAKIQDGSNSEVDSSPVRPDQAMILRPDNPLVPITKSDEVDSSPVRPDQAMILRPDNFGVINEDTNDNEVDSSPVRPDQAMILRPNQEMILRPDGSMIKVEEAKFTTSITNATETVDNMSHLGARRDVTESLREKRWGWPIDWIRKTGVRWLEKYHVLRRGEKLREAMINNNTSQWTMAEVNGAAAKVNELRANGQLEQRKITERFNKGQLIGNESQFVATGELKKLIRTEIIANIVDNKIENPEQLRIALAKFVKDNLTNNTIVDFDGKDTVGQQLQQVFGADASQFGRIADYFATDLLEMGSNIRKHLAKHNQSLAEIDKQIEIKLGNARLANGGKNQDFVDRLISLSRKYQNPALEGTGKILAKSGVIFNPLGIGVAASLGYTAIMQGSSILAKKAMLPIILGTAGAATVATGGIAPLLVGATAAGAIAMNRRFWELGQDGMQHTADRSIIGEKITAKQETPKNLLQRFANDFLDLNRRESLNRRRYDTVSAINLIEGGGNDPSGNVRRSVSELRKLDISEGQEANRNEIARRIAEIQTRLDFNFDGQLTFNNHTINTRKAALIDYENSTEANTKPTDLLIEKNKLKDVLSRGGMNKEQIDLLIGAERVIMSKYFIRNIEQQNRAFMKYRLLNSAGAGVFGAGVGILGGLFAQEVVTAASRVAQPILENVVNNINTNPLLLWAMNTVRTISQGRTIRENLFNTGPSVEQQNTGITRQALRDLFSRPGTLQVDKDLYLNVDGNSEIRNASFSSIGNYAEAANENNISVDSTSRILKTPPLRVEGESIIMSGKPDLVNDPNVDPRIRELLKGWSTETNIPDSNESTIKYNVERELTDAISNNRVAGFAQGNLEVSVGDPANPSIRPDGQISLRLLRDHLEDPSIRMENGKVSPEFEDARKFAVHIFGKAQLIDGRPSVTIDPTLPGSPPYLGPDGQMTREWLDIKNELIKNQWDVREVIVDGNPQLQIVQHTNWELQPTVATKFTPPIIAGPMESFVTPISAVPRHALSSMEKNHQDSNSESPLLQEGIPPITEDTGNKSKVRRFGRGMSKKFKKGFEAFNDGMNKGTEAVDKAFGNKTPQREKTDERTQEENPSDLEPTRNDSRVQRVYDVVNDRMNAGLAAVDRAFSKSESAGTSSDELIELPIAPSSTVSSTDPGVDNTVDNRLNSGLEKVDDLRNSTESRSLPINDTVNQISSNVNALLNTGTERIDQVKANLEANLNSALSQINSVLTVGALNAISGIDYAFRPEVQEQLNRDILKLDADIQAKWQQLATFLAQMRATKNNAGNSIYTAINDSLNAGLDRVDQAKAAADAKVEGLVDQAKSSAENTYNTANDSLNAGLNQLDQARINTEGKIGETRDKAGAVPTNITATANQIYTNVNALLNKGTDKIDQTKANLETDLNNAVAQVQSALTVGALNAINGIDYAFRPEVQEQLNSDILKLDAGIQAKWQQLTTLLAQMRAKKNNTAVTPPPIENNIPEELAVEKPQGTEITPTENISAEILTSEPKTTKFTLPELSTELPTELTQTDLPPEQINQLKQLLFLNNMVINLSQKPNYDGSDFVHLQTQIMQAMDRLGSNTNNSWSYSDKDGLTIKDKHYTAAEFNDLRNQFIDINFAKLPGGAKLENYRDMVVPRSFNIGNMWREFGAKSFFKNLGLAALQEQIKAEELRYAPAVLRWGDEVQQKWIIDKIQQNIPQI